MAFKRTRVAWQWLARDDAADVEREVGEPGQACALGVAMPDIEPPATYLPASVLARDAVEPTFDTARKCEVGRIDCEHETAVKYALVEPFEQHELHAFAVVRADG